MLERATEQRPGREGMLRTEDLAQILDLEHQLGHAEAAVERLPVELPHGAVHARRAADGREVRRDERRVGPVQEPCGRAVMLRRNQDLPFVYGRGSQVRPGVADEVPEDVLLQVGLRVGRIDAAQRVQAGVQRPGGIRGAAVHHLAPPPAGRRVGVGWGDLRDQLAQALDDDGSDAHPAASV